MPDTDSVGVFLSEVAFAWMPILFDAAVKSAILIGLTFAVAWRLGQRSAAGRHLLWFLALASLLVLPVLSALLPGWDVLPECMMLPVGGTFRVPRHWLHPAKRTIGFFA